MLQFWEKVVEKAMIPGRTSQGLRGAYRKFIKLGLEDVIRSILRDEKGRYSHHFQYPPSLSKEGSMEKTPSTETSMTVKDPSPLRADLISDEEEAISQKEEAKDFDEFLMLVEDFESVLCYNDSNARSYNLKSNIKKMEIRNLDEAFTDFEERNQLELIGRKRIKVSENTELESQIYETNDLHMKCESDTRLSICLKNKERVRYVSKKPRKETKLLFFQSVHDVLKKLADIYARPVEEIHILFFEVCCDLGKLENVLEGNREAPRWTELEDVLISSYANLP